MKLETEHLILYPLTDTLIGQILNNEITEFSTAKWLTEDNRTLLTWMKDELYLFMPPKIGLHLGFLLKKKQTKSLVMVDTREIQIKRVKSKLDMK